MTLNDIKRHRSRRSKLSCAALSFSFSAIADILEDAKTSTLAVLESV